MNEQISDKEKLDFMIRIQLEQYRECANDHRHYGSLIWQIPAVAVVVGGTLLAVSFGVNVPKFIRMMTMFIGTALMLVMNIALQRYRMFQLRRRYDLTEFEKKLSQYGAMFIPRKGEIILDEIRRKVVEIEDHWLYKLQAFKWLKIMMYVVTLIITHKLRKKQSNHQLTSHP